MVPAGGSGMLMPATADPGLTQEEVALKATQPALVTPADNAIVNEPAAVLTVANSQGTFVSAVFFVRFEVWDISGAPQPVLVHSVTTAPGVGSTSYTLPDAVLQDNTVYAWRARGEQDGAVGPWSGIFGFTTVVVRIDPPVPLVPNGGVVVSTLSPIFTVANGAVIGDAGTVLIVVEVSLDPNFVSVIEVIRTTMRDRGETNAPLRTELQLDTQYFWRARGTNEDLPLTAVLPDMPPPQTATLVQTVPAVMSDWSATETFRTPKTVVVSTPPPRAEAAVGVISPREAAQERRLRPMEEIHPTWSPSSNRWLHSTRVLSPTRARRKAETLSSSTALSRRFWQPAGAGPTTASAGTAIRSRSTSSPITGAPAARTTARTSP